MADYGDANNHRLRHRQCAVCGRTSAKCRGSGEPCQTAKSATSGKGSAAIKARPWRQADVRKEQEPARAGGRQGRACSKKKPSWSPRARRIKLNTQEMKYREVGTAAWHRGTVENVSQTGLLFRAAKALAENAEVEMILEMPPEIVGQEHAQVIARGMVVRTVPPENGEGHPATAASILDYRVLHDKSELLQSSVAEPPPPGDE